MARMLELHNVIEQSKRAADEVILAADTDYIREVHKQATGLNRLYLGDNLDAMVHLLREGYRGKLDLIYIDPPFFSGSDYRKRISIKTDDGELVFYNKTYRDTWKDGIMEYLGMITTRLILMRDLLSDRGTIYVHVDGRSVHYIRLVLDEVFGEDRFLNEIIWSYKSGGAGRKSYSKKHDNILVYTKTKDYIFNPIKEKSYNRQFKPYRFKNVKEYQDDVGWYTLVNMKDVWSIDMVGRTSSERVGYETQKPEALLRRIIQVSSNEDSIVGDFFMGSGTTIKTASDSGRLWIGSDNSIQSILTTGKRLGDSGYSLYHKPDTKESLLDFNLKASRDKDHLEIEIQDITIDSSIIGTGSSDPVKAEDLLKSKPSRYVDYLGVYRVNKKRECIGEYYGQEIKMKFILNTPTEDKDRIIIRLIDIFGNVAEKILEG